MYDFNFDYDSDCISNFTKPCSSPMSGAHLDNECYDCMFNSNSVINSNVVKYNSSQHMLYSNHNRFDSNCINYVYEKIKIFVQVISLALLSHQ